MTGPRLRFLPLALAAFVLAGSLQAAGPRDSLKKGTPELKSITALAFGPEGILFVGDARAAAIVAVDTRDRAAAGAMRPKVEALDEKIASLLGIEAGQLAINAFAVNPLSGNAYLGVMRGKGKGSTPVLVRVDRASKVSEVPLKDVPCARTALPNPGKGRSPGDVITHMAYVQGRLLVACLSNEEFSSQFRSIPFPFKDAAKGTSVEIYHGSHKRSETKSPIRTFVAYEIKGEANLLAAYTCTPLVQIPVASLTPGAQIKGKTIAELGNGNRPLDMIVYQKGGKDYLLLANNRRGVMKIPTEGIDKAEAITKPVQHTTEGVKYDTIESLKGTEHLDAFDKDHALVLIRTGDKKLDLKTIELP